MLRRELRGWVGDAMIPVADFSHLPTRCKFVALMPQWDFLDFLAEHAKTYPNFRLRVQAEVTGLTAGGTPLPKLSNVVQVKVSEPPHPSFVLEKQQRIGGGSYTTAPVKLAQAGYYTYHESIAAGPASSAAATTCADTAETTVAHATTESSLSRR